MPKVARDAVSGEFVTMTYAREHPDTTVVEEVPDGHPSIAEATAATGQVPVDDDTPDGGTSTPA